MATLVETFNTVLPSVVAFASRVHRTTTPGEQPILPEILATGFVVDERGVVVTNRHVVDAFLSLPPNPKTGESAVVALLTPGVQEAPGGHTMPILMARIKGGVILTSFVSDSPYYGEPVPDLAFVQLV